MDEKQLEGGGFPMTHISKEKWLTYANNKLNEDERETYEAHLYQCDHCLEVYMEVIETVDMTTPNLTTETIIDHVLPKQTAAKEGGYRKTFLHYTVAAAMTILLMSSGLFTQLININHDIETNNSHKTSFVQNILNSSFSIIDQVKFKERE